MGNRFREMPQYRSLIRAHGVIAAIVFLFIVPTAILTLRFHNKNYRRAQRIHIWLQILTLLLTTVVFALPFFAVGPKRSITNPHHGIGLAIYIMVLVQFFGGWWVHRSEKGRRRLYTSLKAMVSQSPSAGLRNILTKSASSLAWTRHCAPWSGADTSWANALRISRRTFCTIRISSFCSNCHVFYLRLYEGTAVRQRIR